ncbi:hypothetical protein [Pseudomonas chlororaphis]|uniref:hypothetical protein n=1 Tax=Pseudomonas chlororaphis TaxID=587753 RepID=UPI000BE3BA18|nr:hypothetical protein [Pseudomonas chlororaphis]
MSIDWSKAPPHATHWCPGNAKIEAGWIYSPGGEYYSCYANKGLEHIPEFPEWRKARLVPRPSETCLPPVGTVCELNITRNEWRECKVIAHEFIGQLPVAVVRVGDSFHGVVADQLRAARTPEQIAAEERKKAIEEMHDVWRANYEGHVKDGLYALYDAGWRRSHDA